MQSLHATLGAALTVYFTEIPQLVKRRAKILKLFKRPCGIEHKALILPASRDILAAEIFAPENLSLIVIILIFRYS